jgi:hypothetical protein
LGKLAKKHGYGLIPVAETFGVPLSIVTKDKIVKFIATEKRNQLTKQARKFRTIGMPPCCWLRVCLVSKTMPHKGAFF